VTVPEMIPAVSARLTSGMAATHNNTTQAKRLQRRMARSSNDFSQ
jgi:hypothetical protein